jgi:outer membrane lipoprotein-sorting protein
MARLPARLASAKVDRFTTGSTDRRQRDQMKPITLAAALIAATAIVSPAVAASSPEIAAVQAHLRAVRTMTAAFVQTDRTGKQVSGTLTLKQPGKIRFQYQQGIPLLIVGDGKALTMIDYQVRQVSRWPVGDSPLGILLDPSKDMSRFAKVVPGGNPNTILIEGRDPKHPEFGTISIGFVRDAAAPAGWRLRGWTVLDAQNNRSTVALSNVRFGAPVSDGTFRWRDPRIQSRRG